MSKDKLDKFITQTSIVFKSYDHNVQVSKTKSNLWHFSTTYKDKRYNIYCTLDLAKVQSLIKIALKKSPSGTRLVIITNEYEEKDKIFSEEVGYTLIDLQTLQKYGNEIIEARAKEAMKNES